MGAGNILGLALGLGITHKVVKETNVCEEVKEMIKDLGEKDTIPKEANIKIEDFKY